MDKTKCIAALFDFDGVVMDTEPQYTVFWDAVGKKYHPEYEAFGKIIKGQTLSQIFSRYFAGMEKEQAEITEDSEPRGEGGDEVCLIGFLKGSSHGSAVSYPS